jgi:hypothetical protein
MSRHLGRESLKGLGGCVRCLQVGFFEVKKTLLHFDARGLEIAAPSDLKLEGQNADKRLSAATYWLGRKTAPCDDHDGYAPTDPRGIPCVELLRDESGTADNQPDYEGDSRVIDEPAHSPREVCSPLLR